MHRDERLGFDTLVVGSANRLAVAAARAVAESPGTVYNPLFIYGDSGLGKTHLLKSIGRLVQERQPKAAVAYVTLVELVDEYHAAVAAGKTDAWAAPYQQLHMLLVDDIQFLTGRRETQSDLLRLFSSMQDADRQLVLASDRPPSEIRDVDERLVARLAGGLVVDIGAPDYETRAAILRGAASERGLTIDGALLDQIARIEFSNVRELHGALSRLMAHRSLGTVDLRAEDIARAFGVDIPGPRRRRSLEDFQNYLAGIEVPDHAGDTGGMARITDAIARWTAEGYRTGVLERALSQPGDVDTLLDVFTKSVEHLRSLERRAAAVDHTLTGHPVFRDPDEVAKAEALVARALAGDLPPPGPSPMFVRALFDVSTSNQLAANAADAVAEHPGTMYNPLLVHGPSGVGKTHLVHALGNLLSARGGSTPAVACITAERFVDELIAAIGAGTVDRWRARYRSVDALILENVHALAGKERSQDELFHIFNALHGAGKQIVFTSDQPPRRIRELEERLRSRFDGGLVVPIAAPDRALRERVIARALAQHGHGLDAELVRAVAEKPTLNVRDLLALVHRLIVSADTQSVPLSAGFVRGEGPVRRNTPMRPSMRAVDSTFLDREKVVWEWPDTTARIIEDLR